MMNTAVVLLVLCTVAACLVCYAVFDYDSRFRPWSVVGLGLAVLLIAGMRWVRSRMLALLMILAIFGGLFASLYPVIRNRSWSVWLSSAAIICVVGTILVLKLWNPLTGLPPAAVHRRGRPALSSPGSIKVLSWNVFLRSVASQRLGQNDYKEERVGHIADAIRGCDVVCLQEACSTANFRVHRLLKLARANGFRYFVTPASPPIFSRSLIDSGLLLLSRIPISTHGSAGLPVGIGDDAIMHKALQRATIGDVDVYNTHVQSDYSVHNDRFERFKRDQYSFIGKRIRAREKAAGAEARATILCGDLNCNQLLGGDACSDMIRTLGFDPGENTSQPAATMSAVYNKNSGEEVQTVFYKDEGRRAKGFGGPEGSQASAALKVIPRSVDYILQKRFTQDPKLRSGSVSVPALPVYLSDHRPIKATLVRE